jgi:hypothetical protein
MTKCQLCNVKLPKLYIKTMHTCRCNGIYCRKHLFDHGCTFDYKKLLTKYSKIESDKVKNI